MPSDDRSTQALAALARPREAFESALTEAIAELQAFIAEQRAPRDARVTQEAARLGEFATGSFDAARFSALVAASEVMDPARLDRLEHALSVLALFAAQGDELYRMRVQAGEDLRDAVRSALAARGRVFSAAHQAERLRSDSVAPPESSGLLTFRSWSRLEKSVAPPLLVEVAGADLHVGGLAEYLDGAQKLVLLVVGHAAPAPLSRLIAPGTFVMQTTDPAAVGRLAEFAGPGIAAVMPDGCARFVHDPSRGSSLARRLTVEFAPDAAARGAGAGTARQRTEDLTWLLELAALGAASAAAEPATDGEEAAAAPADQLAGWLLSFAADNVS